MRLRLFAILVLVLSCNCVYAELGIRSILVGDKALAFAGAQQLSFDKDSRVVNAALSPDGKWVAYVSEYPNEARKLILVNAAGGRATVIVAGIGRGKDPVRYVDIDAAKGIYWLLGREVCWSADSKTIGIAGTQINEPINNPGNAIVKQYILLYSVTTRKTSLVSAETSECKFAISPSAKRVAVFDMVYVQDDAGSGKNVEQVAVYDTMKKTWCVLPTKGSIVGIGPWSDQGQSLRYTVWDNRRILLKKIWLADGKEEVLVDNYMPGYSADLTLRKTHAGSVTSVENTTTGEKVIITRSPAYSFNSWAPNNKLVALTETFSVADHSGKSKEKTNRLWVAKSEDKPFNTILIAHSFDDSVPITWSSDASRIAYVSDGCLYVASLESRELTIDEKGDAGLKLTEEEEKQALLNNAKEIHKALMKYADEHDGLFPTRDSFEDTLRDYVRSEDVYYRPGSNTSIFKCWIHCGSASSMENYPSVPLGALDAGYSWMVVVRMDGQARVSPK